jgi:hypothetical protein
MKHLLFPFQTKKRLDRAGQLFLQGGRVGLFLRRRAGGLREKNSVFRRLLKSVTRPD